MTTQTRPLLSAGAGLLAAATVITATPAIDAGQRPLAALRPSSSSYEMLASQTASGSGLLQAIENFLANHQSAVLAFAAKVPSFDIGPVTVGQAVLAKAYYFGYSGSATGLPGGRQSATQPVRGPSVRDSAADGEPGFRERRGGCHTTGDGTISALQVLGADAAHVAVWARAPLPAGHSARVRAMPDDAGAAAQQLFAVLRGFDDAGVKLIWVEAPPPEPAWDGVRDRLQRAAASA